MIKLKIRLKVRIHLAFSFLILSTFTARPENPCPSGWELVKGKCEKKCLEGWIVINDKCEKSCRATQDCNKTERCISTGEGNYCGR